MYRHLLTAFVMLLVLPAFAQAWYVNAKSSPLTGQGTIGPAGTKYYANGVDSGEYTVAPATGYKVSRVTIDGIAVPLETDNTYVVPYLAGKTFRYLVAYYTTNTVSVTLNAGANGGLREDSNESLTNIPVGASRQIIIAPSSGYVIDSYNATATPTSDVDNGNGTRTLSFDNIQSDLTVSATFAFAPALSVTLSGPEPPEFLQTGYDAATASSLFGTAASTAPGTIEYQWTSTPAGLSFGSPNSASTTIYGPAGDYEATLTATQGGSNATDTVLVRALSAMAYQQGSCTSCHTNANQDGGPEGIYNADGSEKSPHFGGTVSVKAQFTSDASIGVSCFNCHDTTHSNAIENQFAQSAHGDVEGEAWWHYDWRSSSRASCARCHAGTAFVAKLGIEEDTTLIYTAADAGKPGETLSCSTCHTNVTTGEIQPAGQFTATYSNGATQSFPDVGPSNLCVRCHGARESGDSIKLSTGDFTNLSFINSHYLAAGSMVFAGGGYEYEGEDYNFGFHQNVGQNNTIATGTAGPCVACHMGVGSADHTWDVVSKDEAGSIVAVNSNSCFNCHDGLNAQELNDTKAGLADALHTLEIALNAKGIYFKPAHPYFYQSDLATAFKNWDSVSPGKGKEVMGAAFNYNLIEHDPGAYAHNREYALKLIGDSIDFLADGTVDGSALFTIEGVETNLLAPVEEEQGLDYIDGHGDALVAEYESNDCSACHNTAGTEWIESRHATGGPSSGIYRANDPLVNGERVPRSCATCHAPNLEIRDDFTGDPTDPAVSVPGAIGCAGCHGDNQSVQQAVTACNTCHYYPGHHGMPASPNTIPEKIAASKHNITTEAGHTSANCQRCHALEGYLAFGATGQPFDQYDNGSFTAVAAINNVSCAACHDPHTTALRSTGDWNVGSAQYNLCTSCHNLTNEAGQIVASGLEVNGVQTAKKQQHYRDWYRNIASTHYDLATTGVSGSASTALDAGKTIEGYVVRKNLDSACTDCHGHELRTNTGDVATAEPEGFTIHTDWASSAHAGALLKKKIAKHAELGYTRSDVNAAQVMAVGAVDEPVGNAWAHYNWDASSSRSACQHCHTAAGAANFLNAAASKADVDSANDIDYIAANNDFSHLADWNATDGSPQNELLYCWGCHSSVESGALRATGPITLDFTVNGAPLALTAADGNSAACLSCHTGRGNAEAITGSNAVAVPTAAAVASPGTKSHYLAAGLTIYQEQVNAGYTFGLPATAYADPSYFAHDTLGCADCHMSSDRSHTFDVVRKNEAGAITQVVSTRCVECHSGAHGAALVAEDGELGTAAAAAAFMEEEAEGYHDALKLLGDRLSEAGTTPIPDYPYFNGTPTDQGHSGAMYNYSYLHHEPGAYAHNRLLAKRLIFDSIDWLDNKIMDGSISFDPAVYPHAATWMGTTRP